MHRSLSAAFLLAAMATTPSIADEPQLGIGDPVPAIDIAHFFQGEPVKAFAKDQTYVLEFWATW